MTTVAVIWPTWHTGIIPRGYADEGMLECIFNRSLWSPPNPVTFEHYEVYGDFPNVDGAVICLPTRHHASREDVDRLKRELSRLTWYVLILCGDEEGVFPFELFPETDTSRVWVMQPRPEHSHLMTIPGGWYPRTHELLDGDYPERHLDVMFAGQVTHTRREECVAAIKRCKNVMLHETAGYLQGMPKESYFEFMRMAKVVPCPSGPMTVDTARAFEAMEAGCVPVVDMVTPRGEDYDYWSLLLGRDFPLIRIRDWATFPDILESIKADWTRLSNRTFAAWQLYKRRVARKLDSDIRDVRAAAGYATEPSTRPDDLITCIITTSPTTGHPDTSDIEETIQSVRDRLPLAEIVIVFDGVRPEDEDLRAAYETYTNRLLWLCNYRWRNVVPIVREEWGHQANSVREALDWVETPYLLFLEHDTPLHGDFDWTSITDKLADGANMVRFHFDPHIHPDHEHLFWDDGTVVDGYIPTFVWWQRPHISPTDFYRLVLDSYFPAFSRGMIEDRMHGVVSCDREDHGWDAWTRWRFYTYAENGLHHSRHLDSRQGRDKYGMVYK